MTFSNRLRMTLLIVAVVPVALIAVIVVIGTGQQVKRIEFREARQSCGHFTELKNNTVHRVERNISYVSQSRQFQIIEMRVATGKPPDPQYRLPILSLDFLEYINSDGIVILSAERPALVGQTIDSLSLQDSILVYYGYENDLDGRHPSVSVTIPTESGYIRGGIYLDGTFQSLAQAVTRSEIRFIEKTDEISESDIQLTGIPYLTRDRLTAVLLNFNQSQYIIEGYFPPGGQGAIFNNFLTGVGAVTIVSLVLVIAASMYFSSKTKREIDVLADGAIRVASGDFSQPVESQSEGELYDLAESFNHMMRQLTDYRQKLIMTEKIAAWQTVGRKVAHEIKNPLTPISIAADDLHRSFIEQQPEFEKILTDCTGTIKHEVDRLKKLIDRFSSFAKMPAPDVKPFSATEFVDEISALYKSEIDQKKIVIENNMSGGMITADADQLRQVIINLLKNSLEADSLVCRFSLQNSKFGCELLFTDDGSGFPEKIITDGITPYFSTKTDGSGLGLLICQRIILDHNGTMVLDNKPEGGARVIITLPNENA